MGNPPGGAPRHILTGEYPPMPGGVSDYTLLLARALSAAGEAVVVWTPPACDGSVCAPGVEVRRLPDHFGSRSRAVMEQSIARGAKVLLQYVPHAFGCRTMNLPLASWLWRRRRWWAIDVMFHEVAMPFGLDQPVLYNIPATVQRVMARMLVRASRRVFVSTESWRSLVEGGGRRAIVTPVFSNLPPAESAEVDAVRRQLPAGKVVGHFGNCGPWMIDFLCEALEPLLTRQPGAVVQFIGRGSSRGGEAVRQRLGGLADRLMVSGGLSPERAAAHVAACDVMLLPYPDGITTRRSSAMAALSAGVPVVTTTGHLTEAFWSAVEGVRSGRGPVQCATLVESVLADDPYRGRLSAAARMLYAEQFDILHTVRLLRESDSAES